MSTQNLEKSAEQQISQILRQIKQTQKQINRKASLILKRIEEFLFKSPYKLTEAQETVLLIGSEESDNKGLLYLCGLKHRIQNSLKKSAFSALKLLLRLLVEGRQKEEFLKIFCDLDDEEFKLLKLSNHILLAEKAHDYTAYNVAMLIKEKRPHLASSVYILGKKAQEIFEEWSKDEKVKRNKEIAKNTEWNEEEKSEKKTMNHRQSIESMETRKFKKKACDTFLVLYFERTHEYYLQSFTDPLKALSEVSETKNDPSKNRASLRKKSKLKTLFQTKAKKVELSEKSEEIVEKLHIDSPSFDPYTLLITLYNDESPSFFAKVTEQLQSQQKEVLSLNKSLIYYNIIDYVNTEKSINTIMLDHIKKEARKDSGISLELRNSMVGLQLSLSTYADPLLRCKSKSDHIRTILSLFHKYQFVLESPGKMRQALLQKDMRSLTRVFSKNSLYLKGFSKLPIFSKVNEEIQILTTELAERVLEFASLKPRKFEKIQETIQALFVLTVTPNPLEFILEQLLSKLMYRLERNFRTLIFEEKIVKSNKQAKMSMAEPMEESDEGDLLSCLAAEGTLEERRYTMRKSENLNNEILPQLENFMQLCKQYKEGVFDFRFKDFPCDFENIIENRENTINLLLNNFFEKFLSLFRELLLRLTKFLKSEENKRKRFKILKTDLKTFAKRLNEFESLIKRFDISLEELRKLKEEIVGLFVQAMTGNLTENGNEL